MMLGVSNYLEVDRTQWMQNWPGQIVLNGSQVTKYAQWAPYCPVCDVASVIPGGAILDASLYLNSY